MLDTKLKHRCPRCGGTVFTERDILDGEWYQFCLQCSHREYFRNEAEDKGRNGEQRAGRKRKKRKRRKRNDNKEPDNRSQ